MKYMVGYFVSLGQPSWSSVASQLKPGGRVINLVDGFMLALNLVASFNLSIIGILFLGLSYGLQMTILKHR